MEIYDTNFELVDRQWHEKENYLVKDFDNQSGRCLVLCSDNGIYYPFTEEAFVEKIVEKDTFQYLNITKDSVIKKHFSRIIYIREVWRSWYLLGLNAKVDSIDQTIQLLKNLTAGYQTTYAGISSGGYMAMILGCKLDGERVFSFCGQFCLQPWLNERMFGKYLEDATRNQYFDIASLVQKAETPIFYFYPYENQMDHMQKNYICSQTNTENIRVMAFKGANHGRQITSYTFKYLFTMTNDKLDKLFQKYRKKTVHRYQIQLSAGGFRGYVDLVLAGLHRLKKKLHGS